MRFKKLLFESEEKVEEFNQLLEKEFKNDLPQLLFRSTDSDIGDRSFEVRKIKKERQSIGPNLAQVVLDKMAMERYDNVPLRSQSKFASSPEKLGYFGKYEYIIFPDKKADIVSFDRDTLSYRKDFKNALVFLVRLSNSHEFIREKYKYLFRLYTVYFDQENKLRGFVNKKWSKIEDDLKKFKNDKRLLGRIEDQLSEGLREEIEFKINSVLDPSYFRNMKRGFHEDSGEVLFDGEKYLYVKPKFFKKHFQWNGNKWILK